MWSGFSAMCYMSLEVSKFVKKGDQKGIGTQIQVHGDPVSFSSLWRTMITELAVPSPRNAKLERGGIDLFGKEGKSCGRDVFLQSVRELFTHP